MRLESLLEGHGVSARVFPPTALWNAASYARLVWARLRIGEHTKLNKGLSLVAAHAESGKGWRLQDEHHQVLEQFEFDEELDSDLEPLQRILRTTQTG